MNYETATNDDLEIRLGELLGMGRFAALTAPRYCTDWNATMPLALINGVCIHSLCGGDYKAFEVYEKYNVLESDIADEQGVLRAIVICLIKVLESK